MDILNYGYTPEKITVNPTTIARVGVENKSNFGLFSNWGELTGIVRGNMLKDPKNLPKVGDWVTIEKLQGEDKAVITSILPRTTVISRTEENGNTQIQVVNVDTMFIVTDVLRDFNMRRLERYVAIARTAGCDFAILLTKSDLVDDITPYLEKARSLGHAIAIANTNGEGVDELLTFLHPRKTYVFVGSSGVGKSTLINNLLNSHTQSTSEVGAGNKGKHTTTRREMFLLSNGAIVIDTPGIRELGVHADAAESFGDIETLALECKFSDCDHKKNAGCALLKAVADGALDEGRYHNFLKLRKEAVFLKNKEDIYARQKRKSQDKSIHKSLKQFYKQ